MRADQLRRWWDRVWFTPEPAATQYFLRWLVFGVLAVDVWRRRSVYRSIPDRPGELWDPISVLGWFPVPQPGPVVVEVLLLVTWIGAVATLLHVVPRWSGAAAAGAAATLILMVNSFGKIDHDQQMLVIMAVVAAIATVPRAGQPASWRFRWPLRACQLTMGLMLLSAAAAKVAVSGPDWVLSANLRNILAMENLLLRDPPLTGLALWIAAEPWRWQLAAAGTILGEAGLIVAVLTRRSWLRTVVVVAGVGTLVGITLLMGLVGFPIVALAAVFASPGRFVSRLRAGHPIARHAALAGGGLAILAAAAVIDAGTLLAAVPIAAAVVATLVAARGRAPDPDGQLDNARSGG